MKDKGGCDTLVRIEEDGTRVTKPKVAHGTLDEAIEAAKKMNIQPHQINKVVAYKCSVCHGYHTGRNGKPITDKYRNKLISERGEPKKKKPKTECWENKVKHANFKVVGRIDLSKISKK